MRILLNWQSVILSQLMHYFVSCGKKLNSEWIFSQFFKCEREMTRHSRDGKFKENEKWKWEKISKATMELLDKFARMHFALFIFTIKTAWNPHDIRKTQRDTKI